jgi:glycerol-3-phosphate acyltransferase PlsY
MIEFSLLLAGRLLVAFLIGSIPFAVLAMKGTGIDILKAGSGNPGFNNVLRYNKPRAVMTLVGDLGKGFFAVWLFHHAGDSLAVGWLYGFAVVLGHCYSPFLKFNGGKGIATSAGVMLVLFPAWAAACIPVYAVLRVTGAKRKWLEAGTIASLSSWALFALLLLIFEQRQNAAYAAVMLAILAWRHKKNFQIMAGAAQPN